MQGIRISRAMAVALVFACCESNAQSLRELYLGALVTDPALAASEAEFRASQERVRQARAGLFPSLDVTASSSASRFHPDDGGDLREFHTDRWSARLTQQVYRPGTRSALGEAKASRDSAEAQLMAAEAEVADRLTKLYFEVLAARESLLAAVRERQAVSQQLAAAKRSFRLGTVAVTDVREAEAQYDQAIAQEGAAENELALKRAELKQLTGDIEFELPVLPRSAPDPALEEEDLALLALEAIERNPTVQQAQLRLEAATLNVSKQRKGRLPTVDMVFSYGADVSTGTPSNPTAVIGATSQLEATLNLPLFSGFSISAKVNEAAALEDKARAELDQAEKAVTSRVREAYYGFRSALRQITSLTTAEKSAETAVRAQRKGYSVGMSATADVLKAEADFSGIQRDLMKAKLDAQLNRIRLQIALGRPWRENIDEISSLLVLETSPDAVANGATEIAKPASKSANEPNASRQSQPDDRQTRPSTPQLKFAERLGSHHQE